MIGFLLNPRFLIGIALVAGLAFSHYTAYRKGAAHVRLEWSASIAVANTEARRLENARQSAADTAARLAAERARRLAADSARNGAAVARMRDTLSAVERNAASSLNACTASVSALRDVYGSCVEEYRSLGQEAAGHASDSLNYQQAWPKE